MKTKPATPTWWLAVGMALLLAGATIAAGKKDEKREPVPPADKIPNAALDDACRTALACGAEFLLAEMQTNHMGLAVEPYRRKTVVGYASNTTYEVTYSQRTRTVDIPIYENIYEEYETFEQRSGDSGVDRRSLQKVKKKRLVGRKQVGSRKETRTDLVQDPKGSIVKTHTRQLGPIYAWAPDVWTRGFMGQNGMALHALLEAGLSEEHPDVKRLAETLNTYLNVYGIPDMTWDVAWLAAAFVGLKNEDFHENGEKLVSKLLDGQVVEGPGRGLWGPVCVNTRLLAAMIAYENQLNAELGRRKADLRGDPDSETKQARVNAIDFLMDSLVKSYREVAIQGLRFDKIRSGMTIEPSDWVDGIEDQKIQVLGLPYDMYRQTLADLTSTSIALYALRQAALNNRLPKETRRPEVSADISQSSQRKITSSGLRRPSTQGKTMGSSIRESRTEERTVPIMPPEETSSILARAAAAVAGLQQRDGCWGATVVRQPCSDFTPLGMSAIEADDTFSVTPETEALSTVRGYGALADIGQMVGMAKFGRRYGQNAHYGSMHARRALDSWLDAKIPAETDETPFPTFDFLFGAADLQRDTGGPGLERRDLWLRLAYDTIHLQDSEGWWGGKGQRLMQEPSILSMMEMAFRKKHEKEQEKQPRSQQKPFDPKAYWKEHRWHPHEYGSKQVIDTALAMLAVAEGMRPALVGYVAPAQRPLPATLEKALEVMESRGERNATLLPVGTNGVPGELEQIPLALVANPDAFQDFKLKAALRKQLAQGGTLVFETVGRSDIDKAQSAILGLAQGGRPGRIPGDAAFLKDYEGTPPALDGIMGADGRVQVVYLPLAPGQSAPAGQVSFMDGVQIVYLLMKSLAPPGYFEAGSSINIGEAPDPFAARVQALTDLRLAMQGGRPAPAAAAGVTPPATPAASKQAQPARASAAKATADTTPSGIPLPSTRHQEQKQEDEVW